MRLRIVATVTLLAPLCLAATVRAESPAHLRQLQGVQSRAAQSIALAESNWKELSSSTGKFAILMPGIPKEDTEKDKDTTYHTFKVETKDALYLVNYFDMPEVGQASPDEVKHILDNGPAEFVKSADAKLLSQRNISLTGNPGKEFEFSVGDGIPGKGLLYVVNKRMYLVVVVTPQQENAQKFISSFRLLAN